MMVQMKLFLRVRHKLLSPFVTEARFYNVSGYDFFEAMGSFWTQLHESKKPLVIYMLRPNIITSDRKYSILRSIKWRIDLLANIANQTPDDFMKTQIHLVQSDDELRDKFMVFVSEFNE